jgi:hypothetical protein
MLFKGFVYLFIFSLIPVTGQEYQTRDDQAQTPVSEFAGVTNPFLMQAMVIHLAVHLFSPQLDPPDKTLAVSRLTTFSGRSVLLNFEGQNLIIHATLTPYQLTTGRCYLVAQARIWLTKTVTAAQAELKTATDLNYFSVCKSLLFSPGETLLFFPLGLPADDYNTLQLVIQLTPYENKKVSKDEKH